jgi:solute:Na+ symporter, SSS family
VAVRPTLPFVRPTVSGSLLTSHCLLLTLSPLTPGPTLSPLDLTVIVVYFCLTLGVGFWVSRRQQTAGDYFLGARDLPPWAILLSIVATETSALTVISVPSIAARGDLTFLQLPLGYLLGRLAVAWWLLPGYFSGHQDTAYVRLETRFGTGTRRLASVIFLVTRLLADGVRVYASAVPLALITGWGVPLSIVVMSVITMVYTWHGGLKAVVWTDVVQWCVYVSAGFVALGIALSLAGGVPAAVSAAAAAGKLRVFDFRLDLTIPYTFLGGLIGGGMLTAASHGTDQLIVQRLLASQSLTGARRALVGSGLVVLAQFTLFMLIGTAIWAAGFAPANLPADQVFPRFIVDHLPMGLSGLLIAAILAATMGTHSSAISALASSMTHDLYASYTGVSDPVRLLRVGRAMSLLWGTLVTVAALVFHAVAGGGQTPVVVFALSIASITYGALLGAYLLAGNWPRAGGRDVIGGIAVGLVLMLLVFFAGRLAAWPPLSFLAPVARLAWPWYVPLGTLLTFGTGALLSLLPQQRTRLA